MLVNLKPQISWKKISIKIFLFLIGLYLFTIGLSIYLPTAVGVMHLDFTIYSVLMVWKGIYADGTLDTTVSNGTVHWIVLGCYFFILMLFSIGFASVSAYRKYQVTKNKYEFNILWWVLMMDLVIVLLEPFMLQLHELYITPELANKIKNSDYTIRMWIFFGGFLLNALGDAIWLKSNIFLGPYNSICFNFQKMSKWKYINARIFLDFCILIPGVIITLTTTTISWDLKEKFFLNYINLGTVAFIFAFGPIVHLLGTSLDKLGLKFQKWLK
ncbi:SPE_1075/MLC_0560 family membrane protein [Spiroplasma sp. DGKH1]|uniref:SPE_1075/MLC_0560 family membrane protein n=1 Tax=Spiroplasma sp. DGKH1 TaxID=3050074 RepID=UPI0034C5F372